MLHSLLSHASLAAVLLFARQTYAFFPTDVRENLVGNGGVSHIKQTEIVWKDLALNSYFPFLKGKFSKVMEAAMKTVTDANAGVDDNQHESALHFDGESFIGGQVRLTTLRNAVKGNLTNKDATKARQSLGAALHTVQDFYAHSNWIELGNRGPNLLLGRDTVLDFAGPLDNTCTSCSGAAGAFVFNTLNIQERLSTLVAKAIGGLIGAVSDIKIAIPGVRACEDCNRNSDITEKLTSGYYYGEDRPPQTGKCHHGGYFDTPLSNLASSYIIEGLAFVAGAIYLPPTGINKDSLACDWSPHNFYHNEAVTASKLATAQFINDIAFDKDVTFGQLELLFGVGTTFAFVMDTTGSMADIQASVAAQAIQIAADRLGSTDNVDLFIISPFNDPGAGPVQSVSDLPAFTAIMDSLPAFGGDDCPELSMTGILNAIAQVTEATQLFLFTDAASKDFTLEDQVISAALDKNVHINIFKFDSNCDDGLTKRVDSASDKVYGSLAAATGGPYHSLPRNNVGSISSLLTVLTASNSNPVLKISDTAVASSKTYSLSVDSLMSQVSISISGAGVTLAYTNPGGAIPAADISTVSLADGEHITITSPPAGTWEVTITGTGSFNLDISGISPLHFSVFDFVESRGRPGHTGYFPIAGLPPYNEDIAVIARLFGSFNSATFEFQKPDGSLITTLSLAPGSGEVGFPDTSTFFGVLRLPNEPFYVYATGVDGEGQPFQRLLDTVINPVFSNTTYHIGTLDPLDLGTSIVIGAINGTSNGTLTNSTRPSTATGGTSHVTSSPGPYSNITSTSALHSVTEIVYTTTTICPITDHGTGLTTSTITLTSTITNKCTKCITGTYTLYECDCKPATANVVVLTGSESPSATRASTKQLSVSTSGEVSTIPGSSATNPADVSPGSLGSSPSAVSGKIGPSTIFGTTNAKSTAISSTPLSPSLPQTELASKNTTTVLTGNTSTKLGAASSNPPSPTPASSSSTATINTGNSTATAAQTTKPVATYVPGSIAASLRSDLEQKLFWILVGLGAALGALMWEGE